MFEIQLDALPIEVAVLDQNGTILHTNAAWKAHASHYGDSVFAKARIGSSYVELIEQEATNHSETALETRTGIEAILAGTRPFFTLSYSSPFSTGQPWYLVYVASLLGHPGQVMVIHFNISGHELLENPLLAANQAMSDYLGEFTHEARTPLASFDGYMQLARRRLQRLRGDLARKELTDEALDQRVADLEQTLERAHAPAVRLNRLIADLAEVAQMQSGRLALHRVPCDVGEIITKAIAEQQVSWPGRQLQIQLPIQRAQIVGDPDRIGQVVTNYLTNALKYAPVGPIEVRLISEATQVRVQVQDHGPGLPPDEHERIWQRFYRSPNAQSQDGTGSNLGMGLSICRNVIAQHGGQTGVTSAPGAGSTFWFTLPIHAEDEIQG